MPKGLRNLRTQKPQRVLFSENGKPAHVCVGCGRCGSKNTKNLMDRQLVDGFTGIYELEDGAIMEAHEWEDSDWSDYDTEPYGAVYYDIYEHGEEVDGGVLGYEPGDTISDLDDFIAGNNGNSIKRLIAPEGTPEYSEIYNALGYPDDYAKVKTKFGLSKNRKSNKPTIVPPGSITSLPDGMPLECGECGSDNCEVCVIEPTGSWLCRCWSCGNTFYEYPESRNRKRRLKR